MAAPNPRPERNVHQEYIARQRYSNALPPPELPPKLLNIPHRGPEYYTSAAFAESLLQHEPLNIDADAFGGMTIDIVGMPGIFDGDESSIQASLSQPPVHPRDRSLLRPLKSLGQPKTEASGISFLRRTQYTADERGRVEGGGSKHLAPAVIKRRKADASKEDPKEILRNTIKGFDIANPEDAYKGPDTDSEIRGAKPSLAELEAWKNPKHPSKPGLRVLDTYPLLPDLDAFTDATGYVLTKFAGMPTEKTDGHDERMDVAIMRPEDPSEEFIQAFQANLAAHEADPARHPKPPGPFLDYQFFLPADDTTAENIKKKLDVINPERNDAKLYTSASSAEASKEKDAFRYQHVRFYEHVLSSDATYPYQDVALALWDPEQERLKAAAKGEVLEGPLREKGAYYYPIVGKQQLKPRRSKKLAQMGMNARAVVDDDGDETRLDAVDLHIRDLVEEEVGRRAEHRAKIGAVEVEADGVA